LADAARSGHVRFSAFISVFRADFGGFWLEKYGLGGFQTEED
jgi:hypothetical protein